MKYEDRSLSSVEVWGIKVYTYPDTKTVVGTIKLSVTNHRGEENGPEATLVLAAPIPSDNPTIQDAESELLKSAHALITRLAKETPESLIAQHRARQPQENYFSPGR